MEHRGIRYAVRIGIAREEWRVVIHIPDKRLPVERAVFGTREDAKTEARSMINAWMKKRDKARGRQQTSPSCRSYSASRELFERSRPKIPRPKLSSHDGIISEERNWKPASSCTITTDSSLVMDCRYAIATAGLGGGGGALPLPYGIAQIWER